MEEILNELMTTLEEMNDEKSVLSKLYREFYAKDVKNRNLDDEMRDFLLGAIEVVAEIDEITIEDFNPNEAMLYLYNANLEKISELEIYALKLYRLYKKENKAIPYFDDLESKKLLELKLLNEKEIISVKEFEILYEYSRSAQKGFRGRLNNPIPYIQKEFNSKILYNKEDVSKWLQGKKR